MGSGWEAPKAGAVGTAGWPNGLKDWPPPDGIGGKGLVELELVTAGDVAKGFPVTALGSGALLRSAASVGAVGSAAAGAPNWLKALNGGWTVVGGRDCGVCGMP